MCKKNQKLQKLQILRRKISIQFFFLKIQKKNLEFFLEGITKEKKLKTEVKKQKSFVQKIIYHIRDLLYLKNFLWEN